MEQIDPKAANDYRGATLGSALFQLLFQEFDLLELCFWSL